MAQCMTLTKAISSMNLLFEEEVGSFWLLLAGEMVTGAAYALLAWAIFGFAERSARRSGRFDMF